MAQGLGQAFLDLVRAEARSVLQEVAETSRGGFRLLIVLAVAAAGLFWALGLLAYGAVELLSLVLTRWQAALSLCAFLGLLSGLTAWWALRRLRRLEPPNRTLQRHLSDHVSWWQGRIMEDPRWEEEWEPKRGRERSSEAAGEQRKGDSDAV